MDEQHLLVLVAAHIHGILVQIGQRRNCFAQPEQLPIKVVQDSMAIRPARFMMKLRLQECRFVLRIENRALPLEGSKLLASAAAHRLDQVGVRMADEKWKRRGLAVLFAHKNQWNKGRQDYGCGGKLERFETDTVGQTISARAISHLIMILRKHDETFSRDVLGGATVPALTESRVGAGIGEPFPVSLNEMPELAIILIITALLAGQEGAQSVMKIIAPYRIQAVAPALPRTNQPRVVGGALGHQQNPTIELCCELVHFHAE